MQVVKTLNFFAQIVLGLQNCLTVMFFLRQTALTGDIPDAGTFSESPSEHVLFLEPGSHEIGNKSIF